jgi:hypothetical protein
MQRHSQTRSTIDVEVFNNHDQPPRRFAPGRVCAELDCGVYVSIYNGSEYCSLHEVKRAPHLRGRKIKKQKT